jgi:hypothetical protein
MELPHLPPTREPTEEEGEAAKPPSRQKKERVQNPIFSLGGLAALLLF